MLCPLCSVPMNPGSRLWTCGQCGYGRPVGSGTPDLPDPRFERLPCFVAIPFREHLDTFHPVLRLHRLCDAAEILTRFCTMVLLAELQRSNPVRSIPDEVVGELRGNIERPTFGQWRRMLVALVENLHDAADLVVPEMLRFSRDDLLPFLGNDEPAERNLIEQRNLLVHGGAMGQRHADRILHGTESVEGWEERFVRLVPRLAFLDDCAVCFRREGSTRRLVGTSAHGVPIETPAGLDPASDSGRVLLLRDGKRLDLWPLCDFGRATMPSIHGTVTADEDGPLVYIRAEPERLLYAALGGGLPHGERKDRLAEFHALFRLNDRSADRSVPLDFEKELKQDSAALRGRKAEIDAAKAAVRRADAAVLWIAGAGGMGKSYLTARLADHLGNDPKKSCRIYWRFKSGDGVRCSRIAFLRYAVARLSDWTPLAHLDAGSGAGSAELEARLDRLLTGVGRQGKPIRVLIFVDGLDEIERLDPDFVRLPFRLTRPGVVWICAGRPERSLREAFSRDRCVHVFENGLPGMTPEDMRALILDSTGSLKYQFLRRDSDVDSDGVRNVAMDALVARADGLPLYVRFVIEDVLAGRRHFSDLEHRLPPGLAAYYDDLLERMAVGDLQALLTPLATTIAWAESPLDDETLLLLMAKRTVLKENADGRTLLTRGLEAVRSMIRSAPSDSGRPGWEPYHPTFRDHVRDDASGRLRMQNGHARDSLRELAESWRKLPTDSAALAYVLRHGPATLLKEGRIDDAVACLCDPDFLRVRDACRFAMDHVVDLEKALKAVLTSSDTSLDRREQALSLAMLDFRGLEDEGRRSSLLDSWVPAAAEAIGTTTADVKDLIRSLYERGIVEGIPTPAARIALRAAGMRGDYALLVSAAGHGKESPISAAAVDELFLAARDASDHDTDRGLASLFAAFTDCCIGFRSLYRHRRRIKPILLTCLRLFVTRPNDSGLRTRLREFARSVLGGLPRLDGFLFRWFVLPPAARVAWAVARGKWDDVARHSQSPQPLESVCTVRSATEAALISKILDTFLVRLFEDRIPPGLFDETATFLTDEVGAVRPGDPLWQLRRGFCGGISYRLQALFPDRFPGLVERILLTAPLKSADGADPARERHLGLLEQLLLTRIYAALEQPPDDLLDLHERLLRTLIERHPDLFLARHNMVGRPRFVLALVASAEARRALQGDASAEDGPMPRTQRLMEELRTGIVLPSASPALRIDLLGKCFFDLLFVGSQFPVPVLRLIERVSRPAILSEPCEDTTEARASRAAGLLLVSSSTDAPDALLRAVGSYAMLLEGLAHLHPRAVAEFRERTRLDQRGLQQLRGRSNRSEGSGGLSLDALVQKLGDQARVGHFANVVYAQSSAMRRLIRKVGIDWIDYCARHLKGRDNLSPRQVRRFFARITAVLFRELHEILNASRP